MDEREKLEKMDLLRSRFNVSYAEARAALEAANWDAVEASIYLESSQRKPQSIVEELKVTGAELVETLKKLLHEGNISRVIVADQQGRELLNLPVNGALAVTVIIPALTAIGAVVVLAMDYTIKVERRV